MDNFISLLTKYYVLAQVLILFLMYLPNLLGFISCAITSDFLYASFYSMKIKNVKLHKVFLSINSNSIYMLLVSLSIQFTTIIDLVCGSFTENILNVDESVVAIVSTILYIISIIFIFKYLWKYRKLLFNRFKFKNTNIYPISNSIKYLLKSLLVKIVSSLASVMIFFITVLLINKGSIFTNFSLYSKMLLFNKLFLFL